MPFYSYKNCKIDINSIPYYVQSASLSEQNTVEPGYRIEDRYNINYLPADGIGGSLNISYLLTGRDILVDNISTDELPIEVNFGGLNLKSGYLSNYQFNLEPTQPLIVNAQIVFFDTLTGVFVPTYEEVTEKECLNSAEVEISNLPGSATFNINHITKLNYQYSVDIQPHYSIGDTIPNRVVYGQRQVSCDISSERIDPFISVSGNLVNLRVTLNHPTNEDVYQNFDIKGIIDRKGFNINTNSVLDNTFSIKQNNLENFNQESLQNIPSPIVYFLRPSSGYYGTSIILSGNNFDYVTHVAFPNSVFSDFQRINNNQINITLPNETVSGPITLYTSGNSYATRDSFIVGGLPITINSLSYYTGAVNDIIMISGDNFYEISNVIFSSGQEAQFSQLNKNIIYATVPQNTSYGTVKVVSDIFNLSGESSSIFSPIPTILGFYPMSGFTGENITISGFGFDGIVGIKVNNLPINSSGVFTVTNNTGISLQIPSGNTKGNIRLYGSQGVSKLSNGLFYPYSLITGRYPISGRTGEALRISGKNFLPELLYNFGSDKYAVGFYGGATGYFTLVNHILLTGIVPYGAQSGNIKIFSASLDEYPSNFVFSVRSQPPTITYIDPLSGRHESIISVIGENLVNINEVILTGGNTGYRFDSSQIDTSVSQNYINIQLPTILTGGRYSVRINTIEGNATGSGLLITQTPRVSGFAPISGGAGASVTLTGLDIYPFLTQIWIDGSGTQSQLNTGSLNYNNNTVQFYIPNNISSGNHKIIVYNSVGSGSGIVPFKFIPIPSPSGFFPLTGEWGTSILLSGLYFDLVNNISINNVSSNFSIVGSTGIRFTIPNNSVTDYIKLTNNVGFNYTANKLFILPPLIIFSGMSPSEGYYGSGLLITGNYLNTTKQIQFSGVDDTYISVDNFTGVNETGLYLTVPDGAFSERIRLINDRGQTYTSVFNIISGAQIHFTSNSYTGVFKDQIYISGKYLSGSLVYFNGINGLVLADNISRINDTGVYFNIPSGIISDKITVVGRNNVSVTDSEIFYVFPTISGVSGNGSYATGGYITITGINWNPNDIITKIGISGNNRNYYNIANSNEFSGTYKTGYSLITSKISDTFAGSGRLFLISENDENLDFNLFTGSHSYTQKNKIVFSNTTTISQPAPTISSFDPIKGSRNTLVTVNGTNLLSTLNIYNILANNIIGTGTIHSISDTQIQFYPQNISTSGSGSLFLTTPFGSVSSSIFTLWPNLSISGYFPTSSVPGVYIKISGSGLYSTTGISFGSQNTSFIGIWEGSTFILSGITPSGDCCGSENILICVRNEGEVFCL